MKKVKWYWIVIFIISVVLVFIFCVERKPVVYQTLFSLVLNIEGKVADLEIIEEMTTEVVIVRQKTPLVVCRQSIQTPVVITEEMTNEVVIVDLEIIEEMTNEVVIVDLIITEEMVNNLEIN